MSGRAGYRPLLGVSLVLLCIGAALQAWVFLAGGWPSLLPLRLAGFAAPFLAWALWARSRARRGDAPWPARNAAALGVPLLLFVLVADALATGVESTVRRRMAWRVSAARAGASPEVELRFEDAPAHFVALRSRDVAEYLRGAGAVVEAEFVVTRDWGRLRSYRIAKIGDLTRWRSEGGHSGCTGGCEGSPF